MLLIATTVKLSARLAVDIDVFFGDAFKAVGLAFFFLLVALFTLISFLPARVFHNLPACLRWSLLAGSSLHT